MRTVLGGGRRPAAGASRPKANGSRAISSPLSKAYSGPFHSPAQGWRPRKTSWKISTARPKRSWSGVRSSPA